jgi:hypothetical protein
VCGGVGASAMLLWVANQRYIFRRQVFNFLLSIVMNSLVYSCVLFFLQELCLDYLHQGAGNSY